jgi:hypothetical protein
VSTIYTVEWFNFFLVSRYSVLEGSDFCETDVVMMRGWRWQQKPLFVMRAVILRSIFDCTRC